MAFILKKVALAQFTKMHCQFTICHLNSRDFIAQLALEVYTRQYSNIALVAPKFLLSSIVLLLLCGNISEFLGG